MARLDRERTKKQKDRLKTLIHQYDPYRAALLPSTLYSKLFPYRDPDKEYANDVKYDPEYHPIVALRACALFGATDEKLAELLGISSGTLMDWKVSHPEFRKLLQKGKDYWDSNNIESALKKRAMGYEYTGVEEVPIKMKDETGADYIEFVKKKKKVHIAPDPGSALAWLKARSPRWKDSDNTKKREVEEQSNSSSILAEDLAALEPEDLLKIKNIIKKARDAKNIVIEATNVKTSD